MKEVTDQVILYKAPDGAFSLDVKLQGETVWLTQKQMADLFQKDTRTINEHILNVFKEKELHRDSVIRKFRITAAEILILKVEGQWILL